MVKSEELLFVDERPETGKPDPAPVHDENEKWKILIVDDQEEVHQVTKLTLRRFRFEGRGLEFLSAYSGAEARQMLINHPDAAVVLLDVVMEEEDAGLQLAKYIRRDLQNKLVRIILRTGQPGQAPEQEVIMDYDINDYKEKTELTAQKFLTTMVTSLRSYRDLSIIEANRRGLEKIIDSSATIFEVQSMKNFTAGVLEQIISLLQLNQNVLHSQPSGFAATNKKNADFYILATTGSYLGLTDAKVVEAVTLATWSDICSVFASKRSMYFENRFILYFSSKMGSENIIYMENLDRLSDWDRHLIEVFCMNVSIAFDNIFLNEEIEDTQKEIIFTLGEIAEARSQETGFHVKRVAEFAKLLAEKRGLEPAESEIVRMATPMHDVGKLGIPDKILNKPGKLTPDEFEIMKTHSRIGYEMLKNSGRTILQAGALIALQHHERYDGGGYPAGLKGEEIHIYARIVALADVVDALSSDRVYKKAWPLEDVLNYIREERGKHFDPVLVDLFFAYQDELMAFREQYPDR
ncbi:MAG TPA: DUF3369 domain-containing protein [Patescibacteria group bacterium]|nr:DUF3369 domain-containing protein [Patescibacteria group bacterium]